jgi:hypothetical protein
MLRKAKNMGRIKRMVNKTDFFMLNHLIGFMPNIQIKPENKGCQFHRQLKSIFARRDF